jgi:hypothetical protein
MLKNINVRFTSFKINPINFYSRTLFNNRIPKKCGKSAIPYPYPYFKNKKSVSNHLKPFNKINELDKHNELNIEQKLQILEVCKSIEEREVRQKLLYKEYINGVQIFDGKIYLKNLYEKYSLSPSEVLECLYKYGKSINKCTTSCSLQLPDKKIIFKHILNNSYDKQEIYEKYDKLIMDYIELIKKYKSDGFEKMKYPDLFRTIIKKDNDYDRVDIERRINTDDEGYRILSMDLIEQKRENDLDCFDFKKIIELCLESNKDKSNYFIDSVGNIKICNVFDGSHVYNMQSFDKMYSDNAFNTAIIKFIDLKLDAKGNASIRNNKTIDLIKECTNNNKLFTDFINNTTHSNNDTCVEIGKLMDLYNIESHELLYVMYTMGYGNGKDSFTLNDAKNVLEKNNYYVDYLNGRPIKNTFREGKGEEQNIRISTFDSRTKGGNFYRCIISLMKQKLERM